MSEGLNFDWKLLAPEYILVAWAGLLILLDLFWPATGFWRLGRLGKEPLGYIAASGALIATLVSLIWVDDTTDFAGLVDIDDYTTLFRVFFGLIGVFACLASARYVRDRLMHAGEYYRALRDVEEARDHAGEKLRDSETRLQEAQRYKRLLEQLEEFQPLGAVQRGDDEAGLRG